MTIIDILQAMLLGLVEGLTEFIPVSSTGHLILLIDLLGFQAPPGKLFEIVIQLGAILAICWLYRKKIITLLCGTVSELAPLLTSPRKRVEEHIIPSPVHGGGLGWGPLNQQNAPNLYFVITLLVAFLPAMVIGVLAHGFIKEVLFNPIVVAVMLVVGGVLIILIERYKPAPVHHEIEQFSWALAVKIGFCQCLAMIPGTSRSGATIMGALMLKVDRRAATEFSFFLAIPTMLAATVYDLYKNFKDLSMDDAGLIAIGFFSAFIAALIVVRTVVAFVSRHGFVPFAWYRIVVGTVMLGLLL
jgi:undecaprenyl-diphosphatase